MLRRRSGETRHLARACACLRGAGEAPCCSVATLYSTCMQPRNPYKLPVGRAGLSLSFFAKLSFFLWPVACVPPACQRCPSSSGAVPTGVRRPGILISASVPRDVGQSRGLAGAAARQPAPRPLAPGASMVKPPPVGGGLKRPDLYAWSCPIVPTRPRLGRFPLFNALGLVAAPVCMSEQDGSRCYFRGPAGASSMLHAHPPTPAPRWTVSGRDPGPLTLTLTHSYSLSLTHSLTHTDSA